MFDIGPSELLVIFVVALLVIGPERLPSAVRTASLWIGRFRRSFYKIKADVERELNADEIRRQLHNESILAEVEDAKNQAKEIASNVERAAVEELALESGTGKNDEQPESEGTQSTDGPVQNQEQQESQSADAEKGQSSEPTVGGEIKQAVSYVNDISREVKASREEIEAKIRNPEFATKNKPGDKS